MLVDLIVYHNIAKDGFTFLLQAKLFECGGRDRAVREDF